MNVRNLFFISAIISVAPLACVVQDASLTKQEQEAIQQWAKQVKQLPSEVRQIIKVGLSLTKDYISLTCNKVMRVGMNKNECIKEIIKGYDAFGQKAEKEFKSLKRKLKKSHNLEKVLETLDDIFENCPLAIVTATENVITAHDGTVTTEIGIVCGDVSISVEKVTTATGQDITPEKTDTSVITQADIAKIKKVLAGYSFALECL
jgi:superfamily II helicase